MNFDRYKTTLLDGEKPDHLAGSFYSAIENVNIPVWPHKEFPLNRIGHLTLNHHMSVPSSSTTRSKFRRIIYDIIASRVAATELLHIDITQAAFSPSTMVIGFAPSENPSICL